MLLKALPIKHIAFDCCGERQNMLKGCRGVLSYKINYLNTEIRQVYVTEIKFIGIIAA